MQTKTARFRMKVEWIWIGVLAAGAGVVVAASVVGGQSQTSPSTVASMPVPASPPAASAIMPGDRASESLAWRLNNPAPNLVPESRANPAAVVDKFASRVRSMEQRATLRAYEGAPPVIPHAIADLNIQSCRACHAQGLLAGDKLAKMVSHTYLTNCTQCHASWQRPCAGQLLPRLPLQRLRRNSCVGGCASGHAPHHVHAHQLRQLPWRARVRRLASGPPLSHQLRAVPRTGGGV